MPRTTDRLVAALALAIAVASLVVHHPPSPAQADVSHSAAPAEDLGPADAVILADAKPAGGDAPATVRVRANGGRIAWSDEPTAKAWSVGVIHVDKVMKAVLATSSYVSKREEIENETRKTDEEFGKRLQELQGRYGTLAPDSPDLEKAQREFASLRDEYNRWREGAMRIQEKFLAEQVEAAYRELLNAVEIVSDREGIDVVLRTLVPGDPFESNTFIEARDNVVGRAILRYPEAIDITGRVMKELGVQE